MIAFANFCSANEISGVSTWFLRLVQYCHLSGMPVSVLLHGLGKDSETSPIYSSLRDLGVPIRYSPKPKFTEDGVKATLRFLNEFRPKVFIPQCLEHFFYAADYAANFGLPWIFTLHSDDPVYWAIAKLLNLNHPLTATVGVSQTICELTQEISSRRTERIACGVSIPDVRTCYRRSPFKVVYCGRVVEEQKRISLVVRAMALACQQSSDIECIVLGDGPQRHEMQTYVDTLGLANRIQFSGRLNSPQLVATLQDSQVILLLSDYEGLPVALLEAMSVGVVPVARKIASGIPELVRHGVSGLLVDDDPANVANELVRLAKDSSLWMRCSDSARNLVCTEYSDHACFERWSQLLRSQSDVCTANYPLTIPRRIVLKPVPSVLEGRDVRKVSSIGRLSRRFQNLIKRGFA